MELSLVLLTLLLIHCCTNHFTLGQLSPRCSGVQNYDVSSSATLLDCDDMEQFTVKISLVDVSRTNIDGVRLELHCDNGITFRLDEYYEDLRHKEDGEFLHFPAPAFLDYLENCVLATCYHTIYGQSYKLATSSSSCTFKPSKQSEVQNDIVSTSTIDASRSLIQNSSPSLTTFNSPDLLVTLASSVWGSKVSPYPSDGSNSASKLIPASITKYHHFSRSPLITSSMNTIDPIIIVSSTIHQILPTAVSSSNSAVQQQVNGNSSNSAIANSSKSSMETALLVVITTLCLLVTTVIISIVLLLCWFQLIKHYRNSEQKFSKDNKLLPTLYVDHKKLATLVQSPSLVTIVAPLNEVAILAEHNEQDLLLVENIQSISNSHLLQSYELAGSKQPDSNKITVGTDTNSANRVSCNNHHVCSTSMETTDSADKQKKLIRTMMNCPSSLEDGSGSSYADKLTYLHCYNSLKNGTV